MSRKLIEDFGPLAMAVRQLPCAVAGCERGAPSDPAHVRSRQAGYGAWLIRNGHSVGNLAPLCRGHHTGGPGIPREHTHHQGVRTFDQSVVLEVRLPELPPQRVDRLAEVAEIVGEWFKQTRMIRSDDA